MARHGSNYVFEEITFDSLAMRNFRFPKWDIGGSENKNGDEIEVLEMSTMILACFLAIPVTK